jgi:predicted transcriptional regulator
VGEIQESKLKADQTKEAILEFLEKNLGVEYTASELVNALTPGYSKETIRTVLPELRAKNLLSYKIGGKNAYIYCHKIDVEKFIEEEKNGGD